MLKCHLLHERTKHKKLYLEKNSKIRNTCFTKIGLNLPKIIETIQKACEEKIQIKIEIPLT